MKKVKIEYKDNCYKVYFYDRNLKLIYLTCLIEEVNNAVRGFYTLEFRDFKYALNSLCFDKLFKII